MRLLKRIFDTFLVLIVSFICLLAIKFLVVHFIFKTQWLVEAVSKEVLHKTLKAKKESYGVVGGNLSEGLSFDNLEFVSLQGFPEGSIFRVQKVTIFLNSFDLDKLTVVIENARLFLPGADPIVVEGRYENKLWEINAYVKRIDWADMVLALPKIKSFKVDGLTVLDADLKVKGDLRNFSIKGVVHLDRLIYQDKSLLNTSTILNLNVKNPTQDLKVKGDIQLMGGILRIKNTNITIIQSKFIFTDKLNNPSIAFYGESKVEDVNIKIRLSGLIVKPELELNSTPPLPQERLLIMLATNRTWKGMDTALSQNQLSTDLIKDFVDYFIFNGSGEKMANKFGIKDAWLRIDESTIRGGIKEKISNKFNLGYELQQNRSSTSTSPLIKHRLLGDVNLSERLSVELEKELGTNQSELGEEPRVLDNRFLLKYKTRF